MTLILKICFRWYFRKIKRIEAEKKLLLPENEHGAFLIRDSESRHNDYSLSGEFFFRQRTTRLFWNNRIKYNDCSAWSDEKYVQIYCKKISNMYLNTLII